MDAQPSLSSTKEESDKFKVVIGSCFPSSLIYLLREGLHYKDAWAHHDVKWYFIFVMFATKSVEAKNRHLKHGLLLGSTLFKVFPRTLQCP